MGDWETLQQSPDRDDGREESADLYRALAEYLDAEAADADALD